MSCVDRVTVNNIYYLAVFWKSYLLIVSVNQVIVGKDNKKESVTDNTLGFSTRMQWQSHLQPEDNCYLTCNNSGYLTSSKFHELRLFIQFANFEEFALQNNSKTK